MVEAIIYNGRAKPDYIDIKSGMSPLMYAITNKNITIISILLKNGASIKLCDFKCKTPLMVAVTSGVLPIVQLIANGFTETIDLQDENGWTGFIIIIIYILFYFIII